jgi:hypothetical protein
MTTKVTGEFPTLGKIKLYDVPFEVIDGSPWNMTYKNGQEASIYAWTIEYKATRAAE